MQLPQLPATLKKRLANYSWRQDALGESGAKTFRLANASETLFLKIVEPTFACHLQGEAERMQWLNGRLPVPELLHFETTSAGAFLLMTAVSGVNLTCFNEKSDSDKKTAVSVLAEGLRQLHVLPISDCPFNHSLVVQIAQARQNMVKGLVDESDFDDKRLGQPTAELFAELLATCPSDEDLVFAHGDYCLPNVMMANGRLTGFIDLGSAGIADRYQDLALCARSLTYNFGSGWEELLFIQYGLPQPDMAKVAFYQLLDEFF